MTRRRWIADEHSADRAALVGAHAAHLARVLRARVGQEFDIATDGVVRLGRITSIADDRVEFALGCKVESAAQRAVTMVLAIFKFDRFEWAIEKCTELGVATIIPAIARRTDAHLAQAAAKRAERWRRIALEAAQQSRRVSPPAIADPVRLKAAITGEEFAAGKRIVLAETENMVMLSHLLAQEKNEREANASSLVLAAGPEGGWAEDELKMFTDAGWTSASLGPTILRAETAAVAALAIAQSMLE